MSITTNLSCDGTNTDQPYIKLINNKFCVVCQSNVCLCSDLSNLFIPVDQWASISVLLKPNEIKEIDTLISSKGPRIEIQRVDVSNIFTSSPVPVSIQLNVSNSLIDENLDVSLTDVEDIDNLVFAISEELKLNEVLYPLIEVFAFEDSFLQIQTKEQGDSYTYTLDDLSSFTYSFSVYQTSERYEHNRLKFILLQAFYDEDADSNKKHLQYSYNLDHIAEPITWRNMGKLLVHSTDDDVLDADENLIETIWLKNPLSYTVTVTGLVAS
jgi:hypothetical protein